MDTPQFESLRDIILRRAHARAAAQTAERWWWVLTAAFAASWLAVGWALMLSPPLAQRAAVSLLSANPGLAGVLAAGAWPANRDLLTVVLVGAGAALHAAVGWFGGDALLRARAAFQAQ